MRNNYVNDVSRHLVDCLLNELILTASTNVDQYLTYLRSKRLLKMNTIQVLSVLISHYSPPVISFHVNYFQPLDATNANHRN